MQASLDSFQTEDDLILPWGGAMRLSLSLCFILNVVFKDIFSLNRIHPVWPDWSIDWTLGNFSKPLATINFPKSSTFLGNFCKGCQNL